MRINLFVYINGYLSINYYFIFNTLLGLLRSYLSSAFGKRLGLSQNGNRCLEDDMAVIKALTKMVKGKII